MNTITKEQKKEIGELIMVGFEGTTITPQIEKLITQYYVGNIILFARNIKNPKQLKKLCANLQTLRKKVSNTPLLIAADQEGGAVTRVFKKGLVFPGNMSLGSLNSKHYTTRVGKAIALELINLGINVNLAPVMDINSNFNNPGIGVRSFSDNSKTVTELSEAIIKGMQNNGVSACAKHFPGKGSATVDAHLGLPTINKTLTELEKSEFVPFKNAAKNNVDMFMASHVVYPKLDKQYPASLSKEIMISLLRHKMKYQGVLITDDLEMKAIANTMGISNAAHLSLKNGADIVLICHTYKEQIKTLKTFYKSLAEKTITPNLLGPKIKRIIKLKQKHKRKHKLITASDSSKHAALANTIAEKTITLLKNEANLIPLKNAVHKKIIIISPRISNLTLVEEGNIDNDCFLLEIKKTAKKTSELKINVKPTKLEIKTTINLIKKEKPDILIALTYNAHLIAEQVNLIKQIHNLNIPLIVAAIRNPYDIVSFPEINTYLVSYSFRTFSLQALAKAITGKLKPTGKLPVKIPSNSQQ